MTIFTHLLVTTAVVQALNLEGSEIVLAYAFGVGVDFDHLIKFPLYYKKFKLKNQKHYNWRTPLQEPISLLWIIPLSIYLGTIVPIIFFISHLVLDYSVDYSKTPFVPYSNFKTKGLLPNVSQKLKEGIVFILFLCINLILLLTKR